MKYTIHGFSQERALGFRKEIETNGKKTIIKLDCTDLLLLRWFVDFFPRMSKLYIDNQDYAWVNYATISKDLPLLEIDKVAIYRRFKKMSEFGILEHKHIKEGGSYSYYGFGINYRLLIDTDFDEGMTPKFEGMTPKVRGGTTSEVRGVELQSSNKDSSISNSSIINNSSINIKKVSKGKSFDEIIKDFCNENKKLEAELKKYLKMRFTKEKRLSNASLEEALNKLLEVSEYNEADMIEIVNKAVRKGQLDFYPLSEKEKQSNVNQNSWGDTGWYAPKTDEDFELLMKSLDNKESL